MLSGSRRIVENARCIPDIWISGNPDTRLTMPPQTAVGCLQYTVGVEGSARCRLDMQSFVGKLTHVCPVYYCSRSARPRALPAALSVVAADWPFLGKLPALKGPLPFAQIKQRVSVYGRYM